MLEDALVCTLKWHVANIGWKHTQEFRVLGIQDYRGFEMTYCAKVLVVLADLGFVLVLKSGWYFQGWYLGLLLRRGWIECTQVVDYVGFSVSFASFGLPDIGGEGRWWLGLFREEVCYVV